MKAELLILGVLHRGNFHPYEIKRRLRNAMVECYTDVDVGTLYYAIRQLAKNRFIVAVRRERVARGGVRTVYGISASGKHRFQQLLSGHFASTKSGSAGYWSMSREGRCGMSPTRSDWLVDRAEDSETNGGLA